MPRQHTAEFKFEIVRQLQSGEKRLAQVCREQELDIGMVQDWVARVEKHGAQAFPRSRTTVASPLDPAAARTLAGAEARIGELERLVGQLALENEFLKKALRRAGCPPPRGTR
jgi:putative transposase